MRFLYTSNQLKNHIIFLIKIILSFAKTVGNIFMAIQTLYALYNDWNMDGHSRIQQKENSSYYRYKKGKSIMVGGKLITMERK